MQADQNYPNRCPICRGTGRGRRDPHSMLYETCEACTGTGALIKREVEVKGLHAFNTKELEEELARRAKLKSMPPLVSEPDLTTLKEICAEHIQELADGTYHCDRHETQHYYEEAIKAFYGPDAFTWIRATLKD